MLGRYLKEKVEIFVTPSPAEEIVIDGGWPLHQIPWSSKDTFESIAQSYAAFLKSKANRRPTNVIFDGYAHSPKDHEHKRRNKSNVGGIEINILPSKVCAVPKAKFLSNVKNKENFITYLSGIFVENDIVTIVAHDDCDTLIVKTALDISSVSKKSVEVIAEDTDILVLLLHHSSSFENTLFFTTKNGSYNIGEMFNKLSCNDTSRLLFLHSLTVSGLYRQNSVELHI